jgi:hypothetical protein
MVYILVALGVFIIAVGCIRFGAKKENKNGVKSSNIVRFLFRVQSF